ncbi:MAG: helix-turn-helix domain-containing protein [Clostridiales bacterium]|nr:helix-turn-helix domain-containing protein [Clostridiales bacterium]
MRRCKISVGCKRADKLCCTDCSDKTCQARCQNSPSRCKCWEEGPPPRQRERKVSSLQVAWLYSQGFSQAEVARRLGCCRNTVIAILRELGVDCRGQA